ncbi:MAG: DUF2652 domain-containing protein [Alphaproteobacteria bacterium]|nr:DUF2652 domain-containing protein [Alphaproteobacteria bacterium]
MSEARDGWLILADISGYTQFFANAEDPAHAQEVLEGLLHAVMRHARPPLRLVKLEGDAVFSVAEADQLSDPRILLSTLADCYHDFRTQLALVGHGATRPGTRCQTVSGLDLKFVVHRGRWLPQTLGGLDDVVGPDVILAHRLLKNRVEAETGVKAYVLGTDAALGELDGAGLVVHREQVDDLGEVGCRVMDLHPVYLEILEAGARSVASEDADFELEYEVDAGPALAWDWHVLPGLRERWDAVDGWTLFPDPSGRFRVGSNGYCSHGGVDQPIVITEWAPFRRFTFETEEVRRGLSFFPSLRATLEFIPTEGGQTRVITRGQLLSRGVAAWLVTRFVGFVQARTQDARLAKLNEALAAARA